MTEYAVLLSNASSDADSDVTPERFDHPVVAACFGQQIKLTSGLEYEVMQRTEEGWRNSWGESPLEVIHRRWDEDSAEDPQVKMVDVAGETLLVAIIYKDGQVAINTSQKPEWVAAALRDLADSVLVTPPSAPSEPAF